MVKKWITTDINIIDKPVKIDHMQLGLSLFISHAFLLVWKEGYLFTYSHQRHLFFDEETKEVVTVRHAFDVEYFSLPKYVRFVELDTTTANIKLVNVIDNKMDMSYFPIEKTDNLFHQKIFDKIVEVQEINKWMKKR